MHLNDELDPIFPPFTSRKALHRLAVTEFTRDNESGERERERER